MAASITACVMVAFITAYIIIVLMIASTFNYHYMLNYDTTDSSSSDQSDEEKTSADQDIKISNQSNEEKTSTDQDEDIKVISQNSDEENTSSEDENIDIPEPMDTKPTDPYGKRKIESDIQTDDYLRSYNKDFEKVENTTRIFGNKIENIATNDVKLEYRGETSNQPIQQ
ncbi:hypothetical protein Gotur_024692, partial [Gossypium turneri]